MLVFLLRKRPVFLPDRDSRREYNFVPEEEPEEETPAETEEADMPEFTLEEILLEHAAISAMEEPPTPEELPALIPEELLSSEEGNSEMPSLEEESPE